MLDQIPESSLIGTFFKKDFNIDILRSLTCYDNALYTIEEIISWFTILRTKTELNVERCHLNELEQWNVTDDIIYHQDNKYFEIIGVEVEAGNREIACWCQPLFKQVEEGIVGFIIKRINSIYHLLVQAKLESGNFDTLEMAPTVQCITGSYKNAEYPVPYLNCFFDKKVKVHYDTLQSEEGGRFYQQQNRYIVIEVDEDFPMQVHERYIWMTFHQAKEFIKFNNYFNIESRSLIACISPI